MGIISTDPSIIEGIPAGNTQHLVIPQKFITHHPKSGLNPLADCAGYLFSLVGKLKLLKSYRHLSKLQKDMIDAIRSFEEAAKTLQYSGECILVSRYAMCATVDDVFANTPWGAQGQWDSYRLLAAFNQEAPHQDRFFVILERIIKDPVLYIDVMEFMYICLSLGYKGQYRSTEYSNNQLEQITNTLYKRIRAHRGDFCKKLSPYPIKALPLMPRTTQLDLTRWLILFATATSLAALFTGFGWMLNHVANQTYHDLMQMGHVSSYETNDAQ